MSGRSYMSAGGGGNRVRRWGSRAGAQTSTGGLRGFVRDNSGVLAGVTVEASSPSRIGGPAVEVTDGQGLYRFENLPVGEYTLTFTLQGFGTTPARGDSRRGRPHHSARHAAEGRQRRAGDHRHRRVAGRRRGALGDQQQLQPGDAAEHPVVSPVLLRHRHLHAGGAHQPGAERLAVHHLRFEQRSEPVPVRRRRHLGRVERRRLGFPSPDIMQEVQVNAVGASAEFHDFQGGVVNIVTKTGSNAYRGTGSFYIIPPGLVANNTPNEQFPYKIHYNQQMTFEMGGPIVRDRAWFYGILPCNRSLTTGVGVDPNLDKQGGESYKPFAKGTVRLGRERPRSTSAGTTTCSAAALPPAAPRRSSRRRSSTGTIRSSPASTPTPSATRRCSKRAPAASTSATTSRRSPTTSRPPAAPIRPPASRASTARPAASSSTTAPPWTRR